MLKTETEFEKAFRVKGFAFKKDGNLYTNLIKKKENLKLIEIKSLSDYVAKISELKTDKQTPIFYRGQTNANFLQIPSAMRSHENFEEHIINMFMQKFPNEFKNCSTNVDKLCLMQHFGLYTRFLDVTENPFVALYFACQPMKKFGRQERDFDKYGEIFIYREKNIDNIKYSNSRTASIIATTAFQKNEFNFRILENDYRNDTRQIADLVNFIEFKDVVSRSVIVKVKQDNLRIINQQGAFILCNANKIKYAKGFSSQDLIKFMDYIVKDDRNGINLNLERYSGTPFESLLKNKENWDFIFEKIIPYNINNTSKWIQQDPFDLEKIFYKDDKDKQVVFLIPPQCKKTILGQLEKFNITESFIYPDMDSVANELNSIF